MNIKTIKRVFEEYRIQLDDDGTVWYGMVWYGTFLLLLLIIVNPILLIIVKPNQQRNFVVEFRGCRRCRCQSLAKTITNIIFLNGFNPHTYNLHRRRYDDDDDDDDAMMIIMMMMR